MGFERTPDTLDHCPECGEVGIEFDNVEFSEGDVTVRCFCPHCECTFVDVYRYRTSIPIN